jgi:hypothetical protein
MGKQTPEGMTMISAYIPTTYHEALKVVRKEKLRTQSEVIRSLLCLYLYGLAEDNPRIRQALRGTGPPG